MDPAPAGKAGGATSMEIFTSFRSLVDALASEADGAHASPGRHHGPGAADDAPATPGDADGKDDAAGRIALPIDIAALLLSHATPPQGPAGSTPQPASPDDLGHHVFTAGDLAALLLGERGGPAAGGAIANDAAATAGQDAVDLSGTDGEHAPGVPQLSAADRIAEVTLAQALAQRLAGLQAGQGPLATTFAGDAGSPSRQVEELLRQMTVTADRTPLAMNAASHLLASMTSAVAPASATSMLAAEVGAPAYLQELPSAETTDQIVQAIRLQWTKGGGEAQIRLEPRQFGDLTVSVSVNQGQVVARLQADTAIVREWLQANQQVLRQSLADQHLTLTRLEVSEPSADMRRDASKDDDARSRDGRPPRRPRTPDTGETFDIVA